MAAIFGFIHVHVWTCILLKLCFVMTADDMGIPIISGKEGCGEHQPMIVKHKFAYLKSPRFDAYRFVEGNLSCSWQISAPRDTVIDIMSIHPNQPVRGICSENFLKIYDGSFPDGLPIGVSCNFKSISPFLSTTNSVYIQLKTGPEPMYTGFSLYFEHSLPNVLCYGQEIICRNKKSCFVPSMKCDGIADCSDGSDEENCEVEDSLPKDCGHPDIPPYLGNDRIVGGRPAIQGSWPWMVSLRVRRLEPIGNFCGGVLIADKWVLTAGHCFRAYREPDHWVAVLGKHHSVVRDNEEESRYIDKIIIYPDYKGLENPKPNQPWVDQKRHDIALVKLNAPVTLNAYVTPVCLPHYEGELAPRTICHATGWGQTHNTGYDYVLKQAAVPIVSREVCDNLHKSKTIAETMVCAGYSSGGHDACRGDSGGPLVLQDSANRWHVVGIVSTGNGCAEHNSPGIYTEVVHYLQWINQTITGHKETLDSLQRVVA